MTRPIATRLGVEGKAEVQRAFDDVARAGQDAFKSIERASEAAGTATDRQVQKWQRMAAAAREAASQAQAQERINRLLGVEQGSAGSARASASIFVEQAQAAEEARRRSETLSREMSALAP